MTKTVHATIKENRKSLYAVDIQVSKFALNGDEPLDFGGGNTGPAPYDFLCVALGECTTMTIRWYAHQQNWPLEKVNVEIIYHKDGKRDYFLKKIELIGSNLTEEQKKKLIEVAAKCPVQRTIEGTPQIITEAL